jgi:GT2 family glycosyltransferase
MERTAWVSIIICTRNRANGLKECLGYFRGLEIPGDAQVELLVVDNGSTDETEEVVAQFGLEADFPVRYLRETRTGLGHARNTGIRAARGGILAFTDDDCFVEPLWLKHMLDEFRSDPELRGLGGRVELFDPRDRPVTLLTSTERCEFLSANQIFSFVYGCNMAFDSNVFRQAGTFDARFGAGTRIASAEDSDFIYRVYKAGFRMAYCPDMCVYHNHGRRTDLQVARLDKGYAIGRGAFYCKYIIGRDRDILMICYWEVAALMRTIRSSLRSGKPAGTPLRGLRDLATGACYYLLGLFSSVVPAGSKTRPGSIESAAGPVREAERPIC